MKSAMLLAKNAQLFEAFASYLQGLDFPFVADTKGSVCLHPNGEYKFLFYNRRENPSFFEQYEIPEEAARQGYRYGYLAECRSEQLFCDVVQGTPLEIDILVCDSNSNLFKPSELRPDLIVL